MKNISMKMLPKGRAPPAKMYKSGCRYLLHEKRRGVERKFGMSVQARGRVSESMRKGVRESECGCVCVRVGVQIPRAGGYWAGEFGDLARKVRFSVPFATPNGP